MNCTSQYQGFDIEVAVEADFNRSRERTATGEVGYVAVVRICKAGGAVAVFSPLRLGELQGKPFLNEADALMGGYSAGRRIVNDLLHSPSVDQRTKRNRVSFDEPTVCSTSND